MSVCVREREERERERECVCVCVCVRQSPDVARVGFFLPLAVTLRTAGNQTHGMHVQCSGLDSPRKSRPALTMVM